MNAALTANLALLYTKYTVLNPVFLISQGWLNSQYISNDCCRTDGLERGFYDWLPFLSFLLLTLLAASTVFKLMACERGSFFLVAHGTVLSSLIDEAYVPVEIVHIYKHL